MKPASFFHFCPRCGLRQPVPPAGNAFECADCGFRYFFNPAVAAAVFVAREDGRVLFVRRAKDPGRGKLAPPGGFIDFGETAEDSLRREVREEVGLELRDVRFLCSRPNAYCYRDVTYPVLDLFFTASAVEATAARALDEVTEIVWLEPTDVDAGELAFPSMQSAWRQLCGQGE